MGKLYFNQRHGELEEILKGNSSLLSYAIDLLAKLQQHLGNESHIELWLISTNFNLDFDVITSGNNMDELLKGGHGFLSYPRTNAASLVYGIIVQGTIDRLQDLRP